MRALYISIVALACIVSNFSIENTRSTNKDRSIEHIPDHLMFSFRASKSSIALNEEFDIYITVKALKFPAIYNDYSGIVNDFCIKIVKPAGFVQTGGSYFDFVTDEITSIKPIINYRIRGKFISNPGSQEFMLLRGTSRSRQMDTFIKERTIKLDVSDYLSEESQQKSFQNAEFSQCLEAEHVVDANGEITSDPYASGGHTRGTVDNYNSFVKYTVLNVPSAGEYDMTLRYYSQSSPNIGISVNGQTSQAFSLNSLGSWHIMSSEFTTKVSLKSGTNTILISGIGGGSCRQDRICITGQNVSCSSPLIEKVLGNTVCSSLNKEVTLKVINCTGTVNWYRDGIPVNTGSTLTTSVHGNYTAQCSGGACGTKMSPVYTVAKDNNCAINGNCIVNKIRLYWKATNFDRLKGAKIQGSDDGKNWTTIFIISAVATGSWQEFSFPNSVAYQHIRFVSSQTGYGELREIEFYNGNTKIVGQPFGSEPNVAGMSWQHAIDGVVNETWHGEYQGINAHVGPSNFVGISLAGCAATNISPVISKTAGSKACPGTNQKVTMIASGHSGDIIWFLNGVQIASGLTITTDKPGSYQAVSSQNGKFSFPSNSLDILASEECPLVSNCVVNKVRLYWRDSNFERLKGATIQGSNNGETWTNLFTIPVNATGSWQEFIFPNSVAYQHVRFAASQNGYGELREIEFYNGSLKLVGQPFGSQPNVSGMEWQLALDGVPTGMWQGTYQGIGAHKGPSNFVGISLAGCATTIVKPSIQIINGSEVCASNNQTVTLIASGIYEDVSWFRNGFPVSVSKTLTTNIPGSYYAISSQNGIPGPISNVIPLQQATNCP